MQPKDIRLLQLGVSQQLFSCLILLVGFFFSFRVSASLIYSCLNGKQKLLVCQVPGWVSPAMVDALSKCFPAVPCSRDS